MYYELQKQSWGPWGILIHSLLFMTTQMSHSLLDISEVGFGRIMYCSSSSGTYLCYIKKPHHISYHLYCKPAIRVEGGRNFNSDANEN